MTSYWIKTAPMPSFEAIHGQHSCDVVIIGGGMTGILLGYFLKQAGKHSILLEADRIGMGHTGHSTGKISALHHLAEYVSLPFEKARAFFSDQLESVEKYAELVKMLQIDCGFKRITHIYQDKKVRLDQLANRFPEFEIDFADHQIALTNQAQFHPLQFLAALAPELKIYEQSRVLSVHGHTVRTQGAEVQARWIVFACQFPFLRFSGLYALKMHQENSYLASLDDSPSLETMYNGEVTMREVNDRLLFGGLASMTGDPLDKEAFDKLKQAHFPKSGILQRWANNDAMTLDHLPYIGKYSLFHPHWLVATGFEKWGMASAMLAASLLQEKIVHGAMRHRSLYAPGRLNRMSIKNAFGNMSRNLNAYLSHPEAPICSHLGCPLVFNPLTQTYDCPCHGSRFDRNGQLINGPAQKPIETKK
ncbi:MAG TPA: FAD-dependent oxidoreductase [Candidatus Fimiplasma intestinipullorum]|uniref:FAD-dependent oxidoreductase n=1 Tax=Candidatus Fimiplasma intestinipullorum TaxID=2840825 RepID=A0A9D1KZR5_9FIRM|nr:FAD-dependent oxidoreductase [Candidatus Fimiplasma intestinipullorum]